MNKPFLIISALLLLTLNACSALGIATGAAATAGVAVAKEGGLRESLTDAKIATLIRDKWFRYNVDTFTKLNLSINQGRVLVTGAVQDPQHRVEAIRLIWEVKDVKQVINEVQVADGEGIKGFARDAWISTRLRTQMTFNKEVQSINYSIETVHAVVYLMGVGQDQAELNRVIEIARTIPHVRQVVSYVKLAGAKS